MTRTGAGGGAAVATAGAIVLPLALAQFIASYAASNMNVAISTIADDLNTDVTGIQTTITLFTLTMAALMIPGSKLTDIWGRKFCFILGLLVYAAGALLAALAQGLGLADDRLLAARGRRLGTADPADLHPDHRPLRRPQAPRQVVRRGQRRRRARRGRRPADRRRDHQLRQLAGVVPAAGASSSSRSPCSRDGSTTRRCPPSAPRSTCSGRSCRRPGCSSSCSASSRPTPTAGGCSAGVAVRRAGRGDPGGLLRPRARPGAPRPDAAGLAPACSATGRRTWAC